MGTLELAQIGPKSATSFPGHFLSTGLKRVFERFGDMVQKTTIPKKRSPGLFSNVFGSQISGMLIVFEKV